MEAFLASLFSGVAGKLGAAGIVAQAAPRVVEGIINDAGEIPNAVKAFETLASDVGSGKWTKVGGDFSGALAEGEKLVNGFGINTSNLNALPQTLASPAITAGATVQGS